MNGIRKRSCWFVGCLLVAASVQAQTVGEAPLGNDVERQLPMEQPFAPWARDPDQIKTEAENDRTTSRLPRILRIRSRWLTVTTLEPWSCPRR